MTNLVQRTLRILRSVFRDQTGGPLVETALTAPILIFMILGVVEFGRVAYIAVETSNAARAAVSYGSQNVITAADTSGMQAVARLEATGLTAQNVNLTVNAVGNCACSSPDTTQAAFACAGAADTICPPPSHIEQTLNVTVTATFDPIVHAGNFPGTFTITGRAQQKRLN